MGMSDLLRPPWHRSPLDDAVIDRLAEIARIPQAGRKQFATDIRRHHLGVWLNGKDWKPNRAPTNRRGRPRRLFETNFERFAAACMIAARSAGGRASHDRKVRKHGTVSLICLVERAAAIHARQVHSQVWCPLPVGKARAPQPRNIEDMGRPGRSAASSAASRPSYSWRRGASGANGAEAYRPFEVSLGTTRARPGVPGKQRSRSVPHKGALANSP